MEAELFGFLSLPHASPRVLQEALCANASCCLCHAQEKPKIGFVALTGQSVKKRVSHAWSWICGSRVNEKEAEPYHGAHYKGPGSENFPPAYPPSQGLLCSSLRDSMFCFAKGLTVVSKVRVRPRALRRKGRCNRPALGGNHSLFPMEILFSVQWVSHNEGSGFFIHWVVSLGSTRDLSIETEVDFPVGIGQMGSVQHCSLDPLWSQPPRLGKALVKRLLVWDLV